MPDHASEARTTARNTRGKPPALLARKSRGPQYADSAATATPLWVPAPQVGLDPAYGVNGIAWRQSALPVRGADVDFAGPIMRAQFTLLVGPTVKVDSIAEVVRLGASIAVVRGHAMETLGARRAAEARRAEGSPIGGG